MAREHLPPSHHSDKLLSLDGDGANLFCKLCRMLGLVDSVLVAFQTLTHTDHTTIMRHGTMDYHKHILT